MRTEFGYARPRLSSRLLRFLNERRSFLPMRTVCGFILLTIYLHELGASSSALFMTFLRTRGVGRRTYRGNLRQKGRVGSAGFCWEPTGTRTRSCADGRPKSLF